MGIMGIAVYSRLGDVLRNQGLTVSDLQRRIAARFRFAVDERTLDRLARADHVRRPNLEIVAAAADVLGVGFDDIFVVGTTSADTNGPGIERARDEEEDVLDPDQSRRLEDLLEARDWRTLTDDESAELGGAGGRMGTPRERAGAARHRGEARAAYRAGARRCSRRPRPCACMVGGSPGRSGAPGGARRGSPRKPTGPRGRLMRSAPRQQRTRRTR